MGNMLIYSNITPAFSFKKLSLEGPLPQIPNSNPESNFAKPKGRYLDRWLINRSGGRRLRIGVRQRRRLLQARALDTCGAAVVVCCVQRLPQVLQQAGDRFLCSFTLPLSRK